MTQVHHMDRDPAWVRDKAYYPVVWRQEKTEWSPIGMHHKLLREVTAAWAAQDVAALFRTSCKSLAGAEVQRPQLFAIHSLLLAPFPLIHPPPDRLQMSIFPDQRQLHDFERSDLFRCA